MIDGRWQMEDGRPVQHLVRRRASLGVYHQAMDELLSISARYSFTLETTHETREARDKLKGQDTRDKTLKNRQDTRDNRDETPERQERRETKLTKRWGTPILPQNPSCSASPLHLFAPHCFLARRSFLGFVWSCWVDSGRVYSHCVGPPSSAHHREDAVEWCEKQGTESSGMSGSTRKREIVLADKGSK